MSASRTLLRHLTKQRVTLPDGQVIFADLDRKRARRPKQPFWRVTTLSLLDGIEHSLHATKGHRFVRLH